MRKKRVRQILRSVIDPVIVRALFAACVAAAIIVSIRHAEHRRASLCIALMFVVDLARAARPSSALVHVPLYLAWPSLAAFASGLRARMIVVAWATSAVIVLLACDGRPERMIAYAIAHGCACFGAAWLTARVLGARRLFSRGEVVALMLGCAELSCAPLLLLPVANWRAHVGVHSVLVWGLLLFIHCRWMSPWVSGLRSSHFWRRRLLRSR